MMRSGLVVKRLAALPRTCLGSTRHKTTGAGIDKTSKPRLPSPCIHSHMESKRATGNHQDKPMSFEQREMLSSILRVDQAGELGANAIYQGQLAALNKNDSKLRNLIQHMWDQEKVHLSKFNELIPHWNARSSVLLPLWHVAGLLLGYTTAKLGKEAAMTCTEAVETVIGKHYNEQVRELVALLEDPNNVNLERRQELVELVETIKSFRDDELEHLDTAVQHDSKQAPAYEVLTGIIQGGCAAAIEVAKRI